MKLIKDNFKRSDLEASEKRIKQFIMDYVSANNLIAKSWKHNKASVSLGLSLVAQYQQHLPNFNIFISDEFKLFNSQNQVSHNLSFENQHKEHFILSAFSSFEPLDKIIFTKTMLYNSIDRLTYKTIISKLDIDDFWLTFRHIAPFVKSGQSVNDVREALTVIQSKSIDTEEKVLSFAYYLQYYKQICKRTDIKSGVLKLLKNKVDEQYYPIFEKILGSPILQNEVQTNKLIKSSEIKLLLLDKPSIFEEISFAQIPQAQVSNYNRYFSLINDFLTSKLGKELTGINRIDYYELNSSKEPARLYIEHTSIGFKVNVEDLYLHLVKSCSHLFPLQYSRENPLLQPLETAINFYLLNQKINSDTIDDYAKSKKIHKI